MPQLGRAADLARSCTSSASKAVGGVCAETVRRDMGQYCGSASSVRFSAQADSGGELTSDGRALGCCSRYMATTPATCGAAMLVPEPQVYEVSFTCTWAPHNPSSDSCGLRSTWGWFDPVSSTSSASDSEYGPVCTGTSRHMQHRHPHLQMKIWCQGRWPVISRRTACCKHYLMLWPALGMDKFRNVIVMLSAQGITVLLAPCKRRISHVRACEVPPGAKMSTQLPRLEKV